MEPADPNKLLLPGYRRISSGQSSDTSPFISLDHPSNEDRAIRIDDMVSRLKLAPGVTNHPLSCLLGVMDGHGGIGASSFVANHLHHLIGQNPFYESIDYPADQALASAVEEGISGAEEGYMSWAKKSGDVSGCCLSVVAIQGSVLVAANVGDCQAILVNEKGTLLRLSKPHRATDPDEKRRIKSSGGEVLQRRVMGVLEPSRAIGDMDIKRSWPGCVTADPYVTVETLSYTPGKGPSYLAVASDGVWDSLSPEAVAKLVTDGFDKHTNPHTVAQEVVTAARGAGSTDDITAVVAKLY